MNLYYFWKIQPRLVLRGILLFALVILGSNLILQDYVTWRLLKYSLILIPLFMTSNVLSEEVEQNRDGILFTSRRPIYRQMLDKYVSGWFIGQLILLILFGSAFLVGLEPYWGNWLVLLIYSTFLSLLGLTAGNLSSNSMVGYGIPLGYWIIQMAAGLQINEALMPVSVVLNLELPNQLLWSNLLTLVGVSLAFLWFNLWYVSKGEGIRKYLVQYVVPVILVIGLFGYGLGSWLGYRQATVQSRVIHDQTAELLVVLDLDDQMVERVVQEQGYQYVRPDKLTARDWQKHHILWISQGDSAFAANVKRQGPILQQVQSAANSIKVGQVQLVGGTAYRLVLQNPIRPDKYLVFMDAGQWSQADLELLLNEPKGNLLVAGHGKWLAKANYSVKRIDLAPENLVLQDDVWLMMEKDGLKLSYRQVASEHAQRFLDIGVAVRAELAKLVPAEMLSSKIWLHTDADQAQIEGKGLEFRIRTKRELLPVKEGGEDWVTHVAMAYAQRVLANVGEGRLKYAWSDYLWRAKLKPGVVEQLAEQSWYQHYGLEGAMNREGYLTQVQGMLEPGREFGYYDVNYIGAALLSYLDENTAELSRVLGELYGANQLLDEQGLQKIFAGYLAEEKVSELFGLYQRAKAVTEEYQTQRWVRQDEASDGAKE